MKAERLLPVILVIAVAAFFFHAYRVKSTAKLVPKEFQDNPAVVLFYKYDCVTCHSVSHLPGAVGKVGPGLDRVGILAEEMDPEAGGKAYLRESILEPSKVVRHGFVNAMPSFDGRLGEFEVDLLVDWLSSLRGQQKPEGPQEKKE